PQSCPRHGDALGLLGGARHRHVCDNQDEVFLGYSIGRQQTVSEATAQKIDAEVRRLVEAGLADAVRILTEKRQDLETLARGLLLRQSRKAIAARPRGEQQ